MTREDSLLQLNECLLRRRAELRRSLYDEVSLLAREDDEDEAHEDEVLSKVAEAEDHELVAIDDALTRIREGCYGQCESCNRRIPLARLEALPYATNCIECQRSNERQAT